MLRSRGLRSGRFHSSPNRVSCLYFSRAGATARTSSRDFVACAVDDASRDKDASVMAMSFMMISYLVFGLWPGVQQPSSDHRPTEGEDCTGEEHRTYARPPGEQSQHGAAEPKREVEKDGVSAHCQAAALRRAPPHGFDAEARIDE